MPLRETMGSLRAWFILLAIVTGFRQVQRMIRSSADIGLDILGLLFALAFLYIGVNLPRLIPQHARGVVGLLWTNLSFSIIAAIILNRYAFFLYGQPVVAAFLLYSVVVLVVTGYLVANVKRLARQAGTSPVPAS